MPTVSCNLSFIPGPEGIPKLSKYHEFRTEVFLLTFRMQTAKKFKIQKRK